MRILMLETRRGTDDGFTLRRYHKDTAYNVGELLAHYFICSGFAIKIIPPKGMLTAPVGGITVQHNEFTD